MNTDKYAKILMNPELKSDMNWKYRDCDNSTSETDNDVKPVIYLELEKDSIRFSMM